MIPVDEQRGVGAGWLLLCAALGVVFGAGLGGCAGREQQSTMVYVVRHAEKADGSLDTALSEAGHGRAMALARTLEGRNIDVILVTEYLRTMQTAMPTAEEREITPRVIAVGRGDVSVHAERVAEAVREVDGEGSVSRGVLVVGHSNTVPAILAALGVAESIEIGEEEFGRLYVVKRIVREGEAGQDPAAGQMSAELLVRRFGE